MILKLETMSGRLVAFKTINSLNGRFGTGAFYTYSRTQLRFFGVIPAHLLCGPFSRNRKTRAEALRKT
jgi:hypothetical protein